MPHRGLGQAEFGRVEEVVAEVDGQERLGDAVEFLRGIVITRAVEGPQVIVCVDLGAGLDQLGVECRRGIARRSLDLEVAGVARHDREQRQHGAPALRLRRVVAAVEIRVGPDGADYHVAPHHVPPGDGRRRRRDRHGAVHHVGVALGPQPSLHAAHRGAEHEGEVVHPEALLEEPALRLDLVAVAVVREAGLHSVARLRRAARPDAVRQDEVKPRGVEGLPRAVQVAHVGGC